MASPGQRGRPRALPSIVIWLSGALVLAILALIVVGIALLVNDKHSAAHDRSAASSTSEEWIASVCQLGTYRNGEGGNVLSGATGSAMCYGDPKGTIFVGSYESEFRLDNAISRFPRNSKYATLTDDSGQVWVFFSPNHYTNFEPLTQFGFIVHSK